ncbi:MAG: scabin-related ADP-ribosyltransferase, partial [Actinomycetes bacterium]
IATAGAGGAAIAGERGAMSATTLARHADDIADSATDLTTTTNRLDNLDDLNRLDDVAASGDDFDPLAAAVDRNVPLDEIDVPPVWRTDSDLLYRADMRGPDEVFGPGFEPRNPSNVQLEDYVSSHTSSAFVSTTRDADVAAKYFKDWVYEVDAPGGIDVPRTFDKNWYDESEIAYPGGVASEFIRGGRPVLDKLTGELGDFVPNPNYRGAP